MTETPLPLYPSYEPVGRLLPNAFGVAETVVMHQNYWEYYDWLLNQGYDMTKWVMRADAIREPDTTFGDHLMLCLWHDECTRYRTGQPCPPSSPPVGYRE